MAYKMQQDFPFLLLTNKKRHNLLLKGKHAFAHGTKIFLQNPGNMNIVFRMKTNMSDVLGVDPEMGNLGPAKSQEIHLFYRPKEGPYEPPMLLVEHTQGNVDVERADAFFEKAEVIRYTHIIIFFAGDLKLTLPDQANSSRCPVQADSPEYTYGSYPICPSSS